MQEDIRTILEKFDLLNDGKLNNASVVDRRAEVLLADRGLTDEARRRAELLERSDAARICTPAELAQILQEEEECYGRAMHGGGNRTEHHLSE